jgi:hypothetical protein
MSPLIAVESAREMIFPGGLARSAVAGNIYIRIRTHVDVRARI